MTDIDVSQNDLKYFKEIVKQYILIDNDIKQLETEVKKRKQKKKELSEFILKFMQNHDIEDINSVGGKLKKSISYTKKPLNKSTITQMLKEYYKNDEQGEKVAKYIIDKRVKHERVRLKRIIKKN